MESSIDMRRMPLSSLKPAAYNPRKALKKGMPEYEKIKRSLDDFGMIEPIVWNEVTGNIVGGHQRYQVLKDSGVTETDVVVVHFEDEITEQRANIALNKVSGEFDLPKLSDLLEDIQRAGHDVAATGYEVADINDMLSQIYDKNVKDVPAAREEEPGEQETIVARRGDIVVLGRHRIMCGDAASDSDVDMLMDGRKANLLMVAPIYSFGFKNEMLVNAAKHMIRGGSAYVFHDDSAGLPVREAFRNAGFCTSGVCVWIKPKHTRYSENSYITDHETVLYGWLGGGKHKWLSDRRQTTVWEYGSDCEETIGRPVPLVAYPIKNSCSVNGIVLDIAAGVGDVLMACEQTNRICYSMEYDPDRVNVIIQRYRQNASGKVFVIRGGCYEDR